MREKIEAGEKLDLFASADMGHVLKLCKNGRAAEAVMFTRNQPCAFAKPEAKLVSVNLAACSIRPSSWAPPR
jgi:molybdate transport system substrate-binding protein